MQVYSQTSTRTTLPRNASAVSGVEFTQRSTLNGGNLPAAPTRHDAATSPKNNRGRTALMANSFSAGVTEVTTAAEISGDDRYGTRVAIFAVILKPARISSERNFGCSQATK